MQVIAESGLQLLDAVCCNHAFEVCDWMVKTQMLPSLVGTNLQRLVFEQL